MSRHSASEGARAVRRPGGTRSGARKVRWSRTSMPSPASVRTTASARPRSDSPPAVFTISCPAGSAAAAPSRSSRFQSLPAKTTAETCSCRSPSSTAPMSASRLGMARWATPSRAGAGAKAKATTRHPWRRASEATWAGRVPAPHIRPSARSTEDPRARPFPPGPLGSSARSPAPRPATGDRRSRRARPTPRRAPRGPPG